MAEQYLNLRVITPKQVIYQGQALSVSSKNSAGKFDILPQHANFITIVQNSPIILRLANRKRVVFNFPIAIVYTSNNAVNIYTEISLK